jgi:hypothetical protein
VILSFEVGLVLVVAISVACFAFLIWKRRASLAAGRPPPPFPSAAGTKRSRAAAESLLNDVKKID